MQKVSTIKEIGQYIRERRKQKGLTQKELSEVSGCSLMFLSALENGKETAQIGKAIHVLHMLGADLFIEGRGGK